MRPAVHIALAAGTVLALAGGGLMLFAPQVPALWQEGFPPLVWTGEGTFAVVNGPGAPLPKGVPLPAPAAQPFADGESRALLVMRDGQLVHEVYGPGIGPETRLNSYSLVKSLVGALVLLAPAEWCENPNSGRVSAYCCLCATPRDWAKVAHYLLQNGTGAHPFLPDTLWRDWILPDLAPAVRHAGAYGGHLRHDVLDRPDEALQGPFSYMAGHGGQVVYLLPARDTVVVRFGARPQLLHTTLYELFPE
ncbi:hypothetical protein [Mameliella alba]|uniref:Beta-lactamase class C-like protein penicillin binding protein n=1 Tax=Mameliella alba TaxID=561184 RepID=A0A0B3S9W8_9RHOB|nr:hypothetical protein [Mameliella alba]KHQ53441.1 Beta-lactamase class C-like protein penicillin binding protein [Mameliella alba]